MTTTRTKLSQWDALLLETLRSLGWTNEELLSKVKAGELPEAKYEALAELANSDPETYETAVTQGYQIKYNTVRGIRSWIAVRFGSEPELRLEEGQEAVRAALSAEEKELLASVLSFGWAIREDGEGAYLVEPIQR